MTDPLYPNYGTVYGKGRLNAPEKSIGSGQPAHPAQADLGRNVLLLVMFLHVKK